MYDELGGNEPVLRLHRRHAGGLIGFRSGNLHPVEQGYEIWASAVAPMLKSWGK